MEGRGTSTPMTGAPFLVGWERDGEDEGDEEDADGDNLPLDTSLGAMDWGSPEASPRESPVEEALAEGGLGRLTLLEEGRAREVVTRAGGALSVGVV